MEQAGPSGENSPFFSLALSRPFIVVILIPICLSVRGSAGGGAGRPLVIRSLRSTFNAISIAVNCLFVVCSGGQRWKQFCGCQETCESLSLRPSLLLLSLLFQCVCVCVRLAGLLVRFPVRYYGRHNLALWEV